MTERITTEVDGLTLTLTNLDRPLFPSGFTKGELVSYYAQVAAAMIPHIEDRAVTRVRFPAGTSGESFYEKNVPAGAPDWVMPVDVATSAGTVSYVTVSRRADLVWLANLAAVELHAPQWRLRDATATQDGVVLAGPDEPRSTTLMVDLDPGTGTTPADSARAAMLAAGVLAELGLASHPKTSGHKGLQLSVPIAPTPARRVYDFAAAFAGHLARRYPDLFVSVMRKDARQGMVLVDYGQNLAARNTVCAYSVRGLASPSVATPLTWDEVAGLGPGTDLRFGPEAVLRRIRDHGDLHAGALPSLADPPLPPAEF